MRSALPTRARLLSVISTTAMPTRAAAPTPAAGTNKVGTGCGGRRAAASPSPATVATRRRIKLHLLEEQERPGEFMPVFEDEMGTYIMNSKDLRAVEHVQRLVDIGVDCLKIEAAPSLTTTRRAQHGSTEARSRMRWPPGLPGGADG